MREKKKGIFIPIVIGIIHFLVFVVLAAGIIYYVSGLHPELEGVFQNTLENVVIFGSAIAFFATITAYFNKGEVLRMVAGIVKALSIMAYGLNIYYSLDMTLEIENIVANVSFPGLLNLKIGLIILYAFYFVLEYLLYREDKPAGEGFPL